jgi:hypothetical protein
MVGTRLCLQTHRTQRSNPPLLADSQTIVVLSIRALIWPRPHLWLHDDQRLLYDLRQGGLTFLGGAGTEHHLRWIVVVLGALLIPASAVATTPLPDLSGVWAAEETLSGLLYTLVFGDVPGTLVARYRVEIVQSGSALSLVAHYCSLGLVSPLSFIRAEVPPLLLASLGVVESSALLEVTSDAVRFAQAWQARASGVVLRDAEAVPAGPDDPRVLDEDHDGHPGVTLHVSIASFADIDLYFAVRIFYRPTGIVVSADRIEGYIEWSGEVVSLGGSVPTALGPRQVKQDPTTNKSRFTLLRIDPSCGCAEVLAAPLP